MVIGVLGGTFDPPHIGHLILAEAAREALRADRILFVPAGDPPHKQGDTRLPVEHRLAMLTCAIDGDAHFAISRVDLDRPGPHYTADTMHLLHRQYPHAELYFIMGGDSLRDLPRWHRPQELIRTCRFAVMRRTDVPADPHMHDQILPGLAERVVMIDAPLIGLSSTDIVERIRAGRSIRYLVPEPVEAYIRQHRLYLETVP
ncbi:MAG: nicotinate-nucleotide adenylyltransferase [Candidatus Flexifilum sp.]